MVFKWISSVKKARNKKWHYKKTINSNIGLNIENAYIHIDEYSCDKNETISARIRAYVSRDLMKSGSAYISESEDIITLQGDYSDTDTNSKKQIYAHMKNIEQI